MGLVACIRVELFPFSRREDTVHELATEPVQGGGDAGDLDQVGSDAKDHARVLQKSRKEKSRVHKIRLKMRLDGQKGSVGSAHLRHVQLGVGILSITHSFHTHNSLHDSIESEELDAQALVLVLRPLAVVLQHLLAVQVHVAAEQVHLPSVRHVASTMAEDERRYCSTPVMLILDTRSYGMLVSSCTSRCMLSNNSPTIASEGVAAASS